MLLKMKPLYSGKRIWRYSLQYVGHFVPASVCSRDVLHLCGVRVHLTTFPLVSYYLCSLGIRDSDNTPEHGINSPWRMAPPEIHHDDVATIQ